MGAYSNLGPSGRKYTKLLEKSVTTYSSKDFRRMGQGIQGRYERCRGWWEPHIRCTREFLESSVPQSSRIAVLGAGRLLDINLGMLRARCEEVHLYDADPLCVAEWKRQAGREYGRSVLPHLVDITGTLEEWHRIVGGASPDQYVQCLSALEAPLPTWRNEGFDGIISLNLLGQIPLYWRDRVLRMKRELSTAEWSALIDSMGRLQHAHMQALQESSGVWSIVISDTEYYFYHVDESDWRVESAIFDPRVLETLKATVTPRSGKRDSWLWHLAPQFIESDEEGEIHRVEAAFMQRAG